MTDHSDNSGDHDHGSCGGGHSNEDGHSHEHQDQSINYPFHYHYEKQNLEGAAEPQYIELPEFILDASLDGVEPAHSPALFNAFKDFDDVPWCYVTASLDIDGEMVLGNEGIADAEDDAMPARLPFEGFLDFVLETNKGLIIRIESESDGETETVGTILDELSRIWDEDCPPLVVASSSPVVLATATEIMNTVQKAYVLTEIHAEQKFQDMQEVIDEINVGALIIEDRLLSEETANTLVDYEKPLAVITSDSQLHAKRLQQWGADCLISSHAHILAENL